MIFLNITFLNDIDSVLMNNSIVIRRINSIIELYQYMKWTASK